MRYHLRHFENYPVKKTIVFAKSDNLGQIERLDHEKTQILDTETGEILSNIGKRSEKYGK